MMRGMNKYSLFNRRPEGYIGPGATAPTVGESSDESENNTSWEYSRKCEIIGSEAEIGAPMSTSYIPAPGGPFSALVPTMWPQDILARIQQTEDAGSHPNCEFDEFGNCMEVDRENDTEDPDPEMFVTTEDPTNRLKWIAYLESTQNHIAGDLTWDQVKILPKSEKLRKLVYQGIPHSMRIHIWPRISGCLKKKMSSKFSYSSIIEKCKGGDLSSMRQIEKDLCRTMPINACFQTKDSIGTQKLKRVLMSIAWLYRDIGYCQGIGMIVAFLLLFLEEEDVFWTMTAIIEDLLPSSYFSTTLLGVQADQRVLRQLIVGYLPNLDRLLREHDIELSLITLHWFLTLMASVLSPKVLLRVWDIFFFEGSIILFKVTIGMLKSKEPILLTLENAAQIFNVLSDLPGEMLNAEDLLQSAFRTSSSLTDIVLDTHRKKHLAFLIQESMNSTDLTGNFAKSLKKLRETSDARSWLSIVYQFGPMVIASQLCRPHFRAESSISTKAKNIKQTEMISDLRESILLIARHFKSNFLRQDIQVDYSLDSHVKDYDEYVNIARSKLRRAKAVVDFERHEDDELGFRRHDVITIISQKDEHCWIGELNGLRGWFPAKFVRVLDERSKDYTSAGDDSVTEAVTDLVRGHLCSTLKNIFEHGLKNIDFFGSPSHPWLFIEEASKLEVEKDFKSVYSRLVLCKTYRLDDDGKVLSPEELLYRAVQAVNASHDVAKVSMDVKLRSFVCYGLNEQVLHLWLEVLCASHDTLAKWYHQHSFLRSPAWIQIKCELRLLSKFSFRLSVDWEITKMEDMSVNMKEDVQDMLVKHHLFSWDL